MADLGAAFQGTQVPHPPYPPAPLWLWGSAGRQAAQLPLLGVQLQLSPGCSVNFTSVAAISCLSLALCGARQTLPCCWLPGLCTGQELDPFEKRMGQIVSLLQVKTAPKITLSQVVEPQSCHICSSISREQWLTSWPSSAGYPFRGGEVHRTGRSYCHS